MFKEENRGVSLIIHWATGRPTVNAFSVQDSLMKGDIDKRDVFQVIAYCPSGSFLLKGRMFGIFPRTYAPTSPRTVVVPTHLATSNAPS